VAEVRAKLAPGTPVEVSFQDEMRVGQKNKMTYRWARKGSRPRETHDQRTQSTYLFGAVCPDRGAGAALVLPACNSEAMQLHLSPARSHRAPTPFSFSIKPAGTVPRNSRYQSTSRFCRCHLAHPGSTARENWLSNRSFKSFDDIVDHCCYAWNTLIDQPWKIMSVARRDWANVGHLF
jgi:hypothetical protein